MNAPARRLLDVSEIARMLDARAEALVKELLPDGKRHGHEWVARCPWFPNKSLGSFSVHLGGPKSGLWKEFAANEAGDSLDLVAKTLFAGDKKQALLWAKRWLGLESGDPNALERVRRETPSPEALNKAADEQASKTRSMAYRLWLAGKDKLRDTPVDLYLRGRGIRLDELGRAPRAIRYHPALFHTASQRTWPAMVTHIAAPDGQFAACHRTWLEVQTDGSVRKAPIENKMVLGAYAGGAIRLWRGETGRSLNDAEPGEIVDLTEGIEDGLSVAMATPTARVLAAVSLSNLGNVELPPNVTAVRLWKQNDDKPEAIAAFDRAAQAHVKAGREVYIPEIPAFYKDANDMLRGKLIGD